MKLLKVKTKLTDEPERIVAQFETLEEARETLKDRTCLALINKGHQNKMLAQKSIESAMKGQIKQIHTLVKRQWKSLRTPTERSDYASVLGLSEQELDDLL